MPLKPLQEGKTVFGSTAENFFALDMMSRWTEEERQDFPFETGFLDILWANLGGKKQLAPMTGSTALAAVTIVDSCGILHFKTKQKKTEQTGGAGWASSKLRVA